MRGESWWRAGNEQHPTAHSRQPAADGPVAERQGETPAAGGSGRHVPRGCRGVADDSTVCCRLGGIRPRHSGPGQERQRAAGVPGKSGPGMPSHSRERDRGLGRARPRRGRGQTLLPAQGHRHHRCHACHAAEPGQLQAGVRGVHDQHPGGQDDAAARAQRLDQDRGSAPRVESRARSLEAGNPGAVSQPRAVRVQHPGHRVRQSALFRPCVKGPDPGRSGLAGGTAAISLPTAARSSLPARAEAAPLRARAHAGPRRHLGATGAGGGTPTARSFQKLFALPGAALLRLHAAAAPR